MGNFRPLFPPHWGEVARSAKGGTDAPAWRKDPPTPASPVLPPGAGGRERLAALAVALSIATGPAAAAIRQFSYDPANPETRAAAGSLTFVINQTMFSTRVLKLRATEAQATADLRRADPSVIGRAFERAGERDVYEVLPADDGAALIEAFCPGSKRAWMAFSPVRRDQDLSVKVVGDSPGGGGPRLCRDFAFNFHGEWLAPPGAPPAFGPVGPPHFPN